MSPAGTPVKRTENHDFLLDSGAKDGHLKHFVNEFDIHDRKEVALDAGLRPVQFGIRA